ncbi:MAG: BlaI/MecI/CopY family transcriptional regulator [Terracidiphilus sp.]|jgi:BlaI family penicillinase repressor
MTTPKLTKLEFQIMEALWTSGESSIREILEALPGKRRSAYTTIQTIVYRLEAKGVLHRVKKVGNVHVFAASIARKAAERRLINELLAVFGGRPQPVIAHLVDTGKLTLADVREAEETLQKLSGKEK